MDKNKNGLELNVAESMVGGVYSNLAMIAHGPSEFIFDFASMLPAMEKAKVCSRVIMTPEHAKRLLFALQDNVRKYEQTFGTIEFAKSKSDTVAPFGNGNQGQA